MSRWKQGDTLPDMLIDCFDASKERVDFTNAVEILVQATKAGVLLWERLVAGDNNGLVTVPLEPTDVASPGMSYIKVKVTWSSGDIQHYPPANDYLKMTVTR